MASGKRAALGHFVPSGRALFPSGFFQLCSNYYKDRRVEKEPLFAVNFNGVNFNKQK